MQEPNTLLEGKYEILNKIREGGMGTIYLVRHRLLDRIRVIKVMRGHAVADPDLKRRFLDEAKMATRLNHPNICTIHDFALDEEATAYLVMEFIDGINLSELLALRGPPGLPLSLEVTHQALLALGYLHRNHIIHRDVAPDNLMLAKDEEGRPLVKVIDLGIAKATDKPTAMTMTGVFLGKLRYASPEQFGTLRPGEMLDGRSDIYSLGVVLYELVTGVRPFVGDSPSELLHGHLSIAPLPFDQTDPEGRVPPELRAAILKALEKRREDRYASTEEFDRDVLLCKETYTHPDDLRESGEILADIPKLERVTGRSVTPSAQDRLDRQFGVHSTPRPSGDLLTAVSGSSETTEETSTASKMARQQTIPIPPPKPPSPRVPTFQSAPPIPMKPPPVETPSSPSIGPRRAGLWILAAGVVVAAVLIIVIRRGGTQVAQAPALEPTAVPAAPLQIKPQPTARLEPTASSASEPAVEPPAPMPTARPVRPSVDSSSREQLDAARFSASRARLSSERARGPDLAQEAYRRAHAKEAEAQRLAARGANGQAAAAFDLASRIYAQSEDAARAAVPTPVPVAAIAPREEPAPQSVETKAVVPAPPAQEAPAPLAAAAPAHTGPSDQDKIRETVRTYERAQSTLDAETYARIFPSVDRARIAGAFQNLLSQTVEFEIRRIQVDPSGTHAEVHGFEKRVAVPRAGSEQRINAERALSLERRGEAWVITRLN